MTIWKCPLASPTVDEESDGDRKADSRLQLKVTKIEPTDTGYVGNGVVTTSEGQTVLEISRSHALIFEDPDALNTEGNTNNASIAARCEWVPHVDFVKDLTGLIKPVQGYEEYGPLLAEMGRLAIALARKTATRMRKQESLSVHSQRYVSWLLQGEGWDASNGDKVPDYTADSLTSVLDKLRSTPAKPAATFIDAVLGNFDALLQGRITIADALPHSIPNAGFHDLLQKLLSGTPDASEYLGCLAECKPNLRILQVTSDTSLEATRKVLNNFMRPDGTPLYRRYVLVVTGPATINTPSTNGDHSIAADNLTYAVTQELPPRREGADGNVVGQVEETDRKGGDTSDSVNTIKEQLAGSLNTEVVFVHSDGAETIWNGSGLKEGEKFNLILTSNAFVSTSSNVEATLHGLIKLLVPGGRVFIQEPQPGLDWVQFVLGLFPKWWTHTRGGDHGPFLSREKWEGELKAAGFGSVMTGTPEQTEAQGWASDVLVATLAHIPGSTPKFSKQVTLLLPSIAPEHQKHTHHDLVLQELQARGYWVDTYSLSELETNSLPPGQDVLALMEEDYPFFEAMDSIKLAQFKALLSRLDMTGLFWVTRPCSLPGCVTDPRYAQSIGLLRSIRSETGLDIATLEMEKVNSSEGAVHLLGVFEHFNKRHAAKQDTLEEDVGGLGPDYEYAVDNLGKTLVNRIYPFELGRDTGWNYEAKENDVEAELTQTQPGRLNSLTWAARASTESQLKDDEVEIEVHSSGLNFRVSALLPTKPDGNNLTDPSALSGHPSKYASYPWKGRPRVRL